MAERVLEKRVENLEHRVATVEQILPTLATKADIRADGEQTRRHIGIVFESLRADLRLIAEGLAALQVSTDARHADIMGVLTQHDRRLTRLENPPTRRSPS